MGGEIMMLVSAREGRDLKQSPEAVRSLDKSGRLSIDLGLAGAQLDLALETLAEQRKAPALSLALGLDQDYGDGYTILRFMSAAKVKRVHTALSRLGPEDVRQACQGTEMVEDDYVELCLPVFKELIDFYREAVAAGGPVIKTIY